VTTQSAQLPSGLRPPQVSVVLATWNRSNVLRVAIESVLRQGFGDWELLVIGDACTDDSAEAVAAFGDPRIGFTNLARNCGEQSGPNNAGCALARGRFVAYLNHDDLWFPDHLESAVACLERSGADLVFAPAAAARRRGAGELSREGPGRFVLHGASPSGRYEPWLFVPASAWVLRRELVAAVGPWRPALECHTESSQDWLFRAFRLGRSLRCTGKLGVLTLPTGERPGAYARREDHENRFYAQRMRDDARLLREEILGSVALELAARRSQPRLGVSAKRVFRALGYGACVRLGVHPRALRNLLRGRRRGWGIQELRRIRGLRPLPR
jgi:glycosyltransferase involved in cell wall biosynthesis